jgi:phosphatidylglycerophosphatase A
LVPRVFNKGIPFKMTTQFHIPPSVSKLYLSWFGVGYCPVAPGTAGSAVTLPLAYLLLYLYQPYVVIILSLLLIVPSLFLTSVLDTEDHDPSWIVIDEVSGQLLTIGLAALFFAPDFILYALSFISFRYFDIVKPWPISIIDQKLKTMFGVILDDLIAAVYGAATVIIIKNLIEIIA